MRRKQVDLAAVALDDRSSKRRAADGHQLRRLMFQVHGVERGVRLLQNRGHARGLVEHIASWKRRGTLCHENTQDISLGGERSRDCLALVPA